MNTNSPGLQAWWRNYLQTNFDSYDAYFLDTNAMDIPDQNYFNSGGGCLPWPTICHLTQELLTNADEMQSHVNFVNAMAHRDGSPMYFFSQHTSFNIPLDIEPFASTNRFVGESCEGCVATYAGVVRPALYARVLNEMAAVNATPAAFLLLALIHI